MLDVVDFKGTFKLNNWVLQAGQDFKGKSAEVHIREVMNSVPVITAIKDLALKKKGQLYDETLRQV